jgi:hypothetical protein
MQAGPHYRSTAKPLPTNRRPRGAASYSPLRAAPVPAGSVSAPARNR